MGNGHRAMCNKIEINCCLKGYVLCEGNIKWYKWYLCSGWCQKRINHKIIKKARRSCIMHGYFHWRTGIVMGPVINLTSTFLSFFGNSKRQPFHVKVMYDLNVSNRLHSMQFCMPFFGFLLSLSLMGPKP